MTQSGQHASILRSGQYVVSFLWDTMCGYTLLRLALHHSGLHTVVLYPVQLFVLHKVSMCSTVSYPSLYLLIKGTCVFFPEPWSGPWCVYTVLGGQYERFRDLPALSHRNDPFGYIPFFSIVLRNRLSSAIWTACLSSSRASFRSAAALLRQTALRSRKF